MLEACDDRAEVFERRVVVRYGGPVFVSTAVRAGLFVGKGTSGVVW